MGSKLKWLKTKMEMSKMRMICRKAKGRGWLKDAGLLGGGNGGPTEVAGSNPGLGCALSILSLVLGVGGGSTHSPLDETTQTMEWPSPSSLIETLSGLLQIQPENSCFSKIDKYFNCY